MKLSLSSDLQGLNRMEPVETRFAEVSDAEIVHIVAEINKNGFCCIPNYVSAPDLQRMRQFVAAAVGHSRQEYVLFKGAEAVAGTGLDSLAQCPKFQSLFSRLYSVSTGRPAPPVDFYQILRCLTGKGMAQHSMRFHYDSYLITALIPVEIPWEGQRGDLVMLPNTRNIRRTYMANILDKLALENRFSQKLLKWLGTIGVVKLKQVAMVPGNLYLFWGYRSVHANQPCDPSQVRATALYHYADPHAGNALKARLRG